MIPIITREENELLTQIEGTAPMGQMIRQHHWIPAVRAGRLQAGGDPVPVRLLGDRFVAFRAADGRVGFFDEYCPHRRCSLTLARNEDNALRCIFHGWKFHVSGKCVEVPTQAHNAEAFAARVPLKYFPVAEASGLIWVWLGDGAAPKVPDFGFTRVGDQARRVACTTIPVNWMQAVEATVDSSHIGFLHRDFVGGLGEHFNASAEHLCPTYEFEETHYGLRGAALRPTANNMVNVRVTEFVMPFYGSAFTPETNQEIYQILVPADDVSTHWFVTRCNLDDSPLEAETTLAAPGADLDDWVPVRAGADDYWGQDRKAMREGRSFSGFSAGGLLAEDTIAQVSMGPIVDRTQEFLGASDTFVVRTRRLLMQAAREHAAGSRPIGSGNIAYGDIRGVGGDIPADADWRSEFAMKKAG